jgi:hypothetical protein
LTLWSRQRVTPTQLSNGELVQRPAQTRIA